FATAQAQWQEDSARALAEAQARVQTARDHDQDELHSLREELAKANAILNERQNEIAKLRLDAEKAQENVAQQIQDALHRVEEDRKAKESEHLASAETEWRERSARELAEATARFEAAETALSRLKATRREHHSSNAADTRAL